MRTLLQPLDPAAAAAPPTPPTDLKRPNLAPLQQNLENKVEAPADRPPEKYFKDVKMREERFSTGSNGKK